MMEPQEKHGMLERLRRYTRHQWLLLLRVKATPENIARGMAVGVFVGFIPLLPSQSLIAIGLAFLVRGSKIAAVIGTLVTNPLTWVFLYILFYHIGRAILPFDIPPLNPSRLDPAALFAAGWRMAAALVCGGLVLAVPSSVLVYGITLRGIRYYRKRRAERLSRRSRTPT